MNLAKFSANIHKGKVYIFGGISYNPQLLHNELWVYQIEDKTWSKKKLKGDKPSERASHSSVCNMNEMIIFGGITNSGLTNEMFIYDFNDEEFVFIDSSDDTPEPRVQHTCVDLGNGKSMFLFGGFTSKQQQNDLYEFEYETLVWSKLNTKGDIPSKRSGHGACLVGENMIIFGGNETQKKLSSPDVYLLNVSTLVWKKMISPEIKPSPRYNHSLLCHQDLVFCVAGWNGIQCFDDFWVFDVKKGVWTCLPTGDLKMPKKTDHSSICYKNDIVVFGGCQIDGPIRYMDANVYQYCLSSHYNLYMSLTRREFVDCYIHVENNETPLEIHSCGHSCKHHHHHHH